MSESNSFPKDSSAAFSTAVTAEAKLWEVSLLVDVEVLMVLLLLSAFVSIVEEEEVLGGWDPLEDSADMVDEDGWRGMGVWVWR